MCSVHPPDRAWHLVRGASAGIRARGSSLEPERRRHRGELAPREMDVARARWSSTRSSALSVGHKLDVLFMVDNSSSMSPLQAKMSAQLGTFMDILVDDGRLPDMHVAVVSSSLGAGRWGNINGCSHDQHPGDDGGKFL